MRPLWCVASSSMLLLSAAALPIGCTDGARQADIDAVLAAGLCQSGGVRIPEGDIKVMSSLTSQLVPMDVQRKQYNQMGFSFLEAWEGLGLLTLRKHPQSSLEEVMRMGEVTVAVTPTQLAREIADTEQPDAGYLRIVTSDCNILSIVQDTAYASPKLPASDQYRLVLGTFRATPTAGWLRVVPSDKAESFRFKALLKFDPFSKSYQLIRSDQDDLDEPGGWRPQGWLYVGDSKGPWP